ncbi:bridging integrator 3 [Anaeramoeba flamelloides]|uniref:Bridging integrator 3 n=1 Tax=Anaeramoeba flamelloides TaxID=1746091 RepID=A0ABQ8YBS4_9EUKA|nr:bridging integrator 3 [Anaeramoeba flamelloides]
MKNVLIRNVESFIQTIKSDGTVDVEFDEKLAKYKEIEIKTIEYLNTFRQFIQVIENFENLSKSFSQSVSEFSNNTEVLVEEPTTVLSSSLNTLSIGVKTEVKTIKKEILNPLQLRTKKMRETNKLIKQRKKTLLQYDHARRNYNKAKNKKKPDQVKVEQTKIKKIEAESAYFNMNKKCKDTFDDFIRSTTEPVENCSKHFLESYEKILQQLVPKNN